MALKQSHINQLHKIISAAEKLITEIEREMQSQAEGGGRGGRGGTAKGGAKGGRRSAAKSGARSRSGNKSEAKPARGRSSGRKAAGNGEKSGRGSGSRRNRAQTAEFRQSILRELEGGTPVADLAAKHGITPAYVYQIKSRAES